MTIVFYHRVIHGLGFFICFKIEILRAQNNKTRILYVLYSDKTWVFDQSERAQGPVYILIKFKEAQNSNISVRSLGSNGPFSAGNHAITGGFVR